MSSNVNEEKCLMHSKIDSEEMITAFNTRNHHWRAFSFAFAEVSSRFRITNEGQWTVFDYVDGLFYRCHKISLSRGGSYKWLKKQESHNESKK